MQCCSHVPGSSPLMVANSTGVQERTGLPARLVPAGASNLVKRFFMNIKCVWEKVLKLGREDPRRIYHSFKVGLALAVISLVYFVRSFYNRFGANAMWAVMTVVVVFEYSVGATLSKGFNRGLATLLAGALGVGVHYVASFSGEKGEPIILGVFVFLLGAAATFFRFFPGIKARYDYGVLIFILTFSLVAVSGYRVNELLDLAQQRLTTIVIGGIICILISVLIFPVWAGGDLHRSTVNNLKKLAESLEACMEEYFLERQEEGVKSKNTSVLGYKTVLDSKNKEEMLANFARWEPPHGQFGFRHPWKQYLKIGAMTRSCACCVEALNACITSEHKGPESLRQQLKESCLKVSSMSSTVLKELATSVDTMAKPSTIDSRIASINNGIEELYTNLKFIHFYHKSEDNITSSAALTDVLPLATVASILIETVGRIEGIISAVDELSLLAGFRDQSSSVATTKSQNNSTISPICDEEGPHVAVTIRGPPLIPMNSITELQNSKGRAAHLGRWASSGTKE